MGKAYRQKGEKVSLTAPAGGVVKDRAYIIGDLAVVAENTKDAGEKFSGLTCGVVRLTKNTGTGQSFAEGDRVYWDSTNNRCDADGSVGECIGTAVAVAATSGTTVDLQLRGARRGDDLQRASIQGIGAANTTKVQTFTPLRDIRVKGIGLMPGQVPSSAAGAYTLAIAAGGNNLLGGATEDLDGTLSALTQADLTLTATTADLDIDAGTPISLTWVSDNADLVNGDEVEVLLDYQYR